MREKLLQIMDERGIKSAQLAAKAGLSTSTVADILSGKVNEQNVGVSKVVKIADALGVSVEFLYGMPEPEGVRVETDQELGLLILFRQLGEESRNKVMTYARDLHQSEKYEKGEAK